MFSNKLKGVIIILIAFFVSAIVFPLEISADPGWLDGWDNRRIFIIDNSQNENDLTDYQILLEVNTEELISSGEMKNDCGDIRVADSDETTLLPYWVVPSTCNSTSTEIWVKIPSILTFSAERIYMYFGNDSAVDAGVMWDNLDHIGIQDGVFDYNLVNIHHNLGVDSFIYHSCILKTNGNVECRGDNTYGQSDSYTEGDATAVTTGMYHTCVLKENGNVDCYGWNHVGQANNYSGGDAVGITAGDYHSCALKSNGNVECWGWDSFGIDNNYTGGDALLVSAGYYHTCVVKESGNVECWGLDEDGETADYAGGDAIEVSGGKFYTCVLKSNGNTECYGNNSHGQADNYTGGDAISVSTGRKHTCVVKPNGTVYCYGSPQDGASTAYLQGDAVGVNASDYFTCVLRAGENVYCYGWNEYGQAEDYTGGDAINPSKEHTEPEPTIAEFVSCGEHNVWGHAWSENIGWVSFSCENSTEDEVTNYGVDISGETGVFSGYAWSENIGWISFNEADLISCPSGACEASVQTTEPYNVSGWARALNYGSGWDGWIHLRGTAQDSSEYGVSLNYETGELEGWAWGGDVVCWLSFNCIDGGFQEDSEGTYCGPCKACDADGNCIDDFIDDCSTLGSWEYGCIDEDLVCMGTGSGHYLMWPRKKDGPGLKDPFSTEWGLDGSISSCVGQGSAYPACHYCDTLDWKGYNDWYLPTFSQLYHQIYSPTGRDYIEYYNNTYWSSSPEDNRSAYEVRSYDRYISASDRQYDRAVRCIREE